MPAVRPPAVAGLFYPREPQSLTRELGEFLEQAASEELAPGYPKVVVVPHAGYIYSGPVAAPAYDLLRPARGIVRRVVLLGPCHRVAVRGMALPGVTAFDTPLGRIPLDEAAIAAVRGMPQIVEMPAAHAMEHALEVQLPFLQAVLGNFLLVPFAVGAVKPEEVACVLDVLWGGEETLIVISSDLSHYLSYDEACALDAETARAILAYDPTITHRQACGATPLAGALLCAKRRELRPRMLDLRNSGDTAGGRSRVVGYGSFSFGTEETYGDDHGRALLATARRSVREALGMPGEGAPLQEPWMRERRATFVSIKVDGALRGCIGSLEPHRSLGEDVAANARAAATMDRRFAPITAADLGRMEIEVSLLSRPSRMEFADEKELLDMLRPGEDGLILEHGEGAQTRRGTFLPQVWESIPQPARFLDELKRKAGLPVTTRITACRLKRYRVIKWREAALQD